MEAKQKALAYITRTQGGRRELLVFTHRENTAEAGIQVPAGSVDPGETPEAAAHREAFEESGLTGLRLVGKVATYTFYNPWSQQWQERHVYHFEAPPGLPDRWTHQVSSGTDDQGMLFDYYWHDLAEPIVLAGRQDDCLSRIR